MPLSPFKYTNNIKKMCKAKKWTARGLASRCGNSPAVGLVYKWFRQERQPGRKYIDCLLIVFGCTLKELLNNDNWE